MFRSLTTWLSVFLIAAALAACKEPKYRQDPTYEELLGKDRSGALLKEIFGAYKDERYHLAHALETQPGRTPITDARALNAIRSVPRHAFVTPDHRKRAYWDHGLPIPYGQIITQPYICALEMQLMDIQPQDRVLEIGGGSGYLAALLSQATPHVFTIEIIRPLEQICAERLRLLGYGTVQVRAGDGYYGWPESAPFQKIVVSAAAGHIPPPLLQQLAPGGKMVIPIGDAYNNQRLIVVNKDANGEITTTDVMPIWAVPLTGAGAS